MTTSNESNVNELRDEPEGTHDFNDGKGPVLAERHAKGGGWVAETASVGEDVLVMSNASVFGNANVFDHARIRGRARVYGDAHISGEASVGGWAEVYDHAYLSDRARVDDYAVVRGHAAVRQFVTVRGRWIVEGHAELDGPLILQDNYSGRANEEFPPLTRSPICVSGGPYDVVLFPDFIIIGCSRFTYEHALELDAAYIDDREECGTAEAERLVTALRGLLETVAPLLRGNDKPEEDDDEDED